MAIGSRKRKSAAERQIDCCARNKLCNINKKHKNKLFNNVGCTKHAQEQQRSRQKRQQESQYINEKNNNGNIVHQKENMK